MPAKASCRFWPDHPERTSTLGRGRAPGSHSQTKPSGRVTSLPEATMETAILRKLFVISHYTCVAPNVEGLVTNGKQERRKTANKIWHSPSTLSRAPISKPFALCAPDRRESIPAWRKTPRDSGRPDRRSSRPSERHPICRFSRLRPRRWRPPCLRLRRR